MFLQYDDTTRANMEIALDSICRGLPGGVVDHATRRVIAEKIIAEVEAGFSELGSLRAAGEHALTQRRTTAT